MDMSVPQTILGALDEGHREFNIAFEGLADEDVWVRAHPRLLSIGELAGHVAYWEAMILSPLGPQTEPLAGERPVDGPLVDSAFRYYSTSIEKQVRLDLGAEQVVSEVDRIYEKVKAFIAELNPHMEDSLQNQNFRTWGELLQYKAFHIAYHTGQIYSVRHLLGHSPSDN